MSQIPQRKHSKEELANLRASKAMQMAGQQVVNPYDKKQAKKPIVILGYLAALSAPLYLMILKFKDKFTYEMSDLKIMVIGTSIAILIAAFIFIMRSLSRHHASFMIIIALISSFSMVHLVNRNPVLKREIMVMLGQEVTPEKSEADRIFEETLNKETEKNTGQESVEREPRRNERVPMTPEERAEMEEMFGPSEKRAEREAETEQAIREIEKLRESGSDSE